MERRMAKDGAIIVVNDTDVDFYESVGFEVIKPEEPAPEPEREIGKPIQEPDPKPVKPRTPRKPKVS